MKPFEYLKEKLTELAINFPLITIKYAYNTLINYHVVELTPVEEFYNSEKLDDFWIPISIEFSNLFSDEYVSFISEDSSLKVEAPELVFNDKKITHIDIQEIFNEILNTAIKVNYMKTFDSINCNVVQNMSYNQLKGLVNIPTQNEIQKFVITMHDSISMDCELPQAA